MTRDDILAARQGCEDIAQEYLRQLDRLKYGGRQARRAVNHKHLTEFLETGHRCLTMAAEALRQAEEAIADPPTSTQTPTSDGSLL